MDNINVEVKLQKQIGDVKIVMLKGDDGASIASIDKTSSEGLVDTYTITLTDGRHTTFQVTNGSSIATIEKTASIGHTDIYTITLTDGSTSTFEVTNGDNWIDNEERTATDFFETINGGLLSSLKVALSPIQDLHGYDSPWVGGAGKNKLPLTVADLKANNTSGTWVGNEYTLYGITIEVLTDDNGNVTGIKAKNGTASANVTILIYENPPFIEGSSYALNGTPTTGSDSTYRVQYSNNVNQAYADYGNGVTFTEWNHATYTERTVRLTFFSGYSIPSGGLIFYPMIRLATETDPTFEPYENICPISGHTEAKVGDDGKNKFNPSNVLNAFFFGGYNITAENDTRMIYAPCKPNTAYTVSKQAGQRYCVGYTSELPDIGVTVYGKTSDNTASSITITTGADAKYIVAYVWHADYDTITADAMLATCQIELGSTATPYVPYNGYQVTVNLGGTYYSGVLDVVSGVFVPNTAETVFDGSNDESWNIHPAISHGFYCDNVIPSGLLMDSTKDNTAISNEYNQNRYDVATSMDNGKFAYGLTGGTVRRFILRDDKFSTVADLTTALGTTNLHVVMQLANPTPIQLSPTMVKALVGENHLFAPLDGQEIVECKYRYVFTWDDVNGITDGLKDRIDDIEDVLAETSYTSAVSCLVDDTTCTITDSNIKTTSLIEVFSSNSSGDTTVVTNIAVTNGQAVLTFDALVEATSFKLRITNL